jgi:hypothetical protein
LKVSFMVGGLSEGEKVVVWWVLLDECVRRPCMW